MEIYLHSVDLSPLADINDLSLLFTSGDASGWGRFFPDWARLPLAAILHFAGYKEKSYE